MMVIVCLKQMFFIYVSFNFLSDAIIRTRLLYFHTALASGLYSEVSVYVWIDTMTLSTNLFVRESLGR